MTPSTSRQRLSLRELAGALRELPTPAADFGADVRRSFGKIPGLEVLVV